MTVAEAIAARHSVRAYKSERPSDEMLREVLEAGRNAPSAVNKQPWRFICLTGASRAKVLEAYRREWIMTAPVVIVVVADHAQSWHRKIDGKDHADIDVAIATDHMTLRAAELGLGTCWVCNFDAAMVHEVLGLSEDEEACVLIPIGFPDEGEVKPRDRKASEEVWEIGD